MRKAYFLVYSICATLTMIALKLSCLDATIILRRSVATGEVFPGLSDIDLSAVVPDCDQFSKKRNRLLKTYRLMSKCIPMLGDVEYEFAIYERSELLWLEKYNSFYRFRGIQGRKQWRTMGQELPAVPHPTTEIDLASCALEELKVWWFIVRNCCLERHGLSIERDYLLFKALTECMSVLSVAEARHLPSSRAKALSWWLQRPLCHTLEFEVAKQCQDYFAGNSRFSDDFVDIALNFFIRTNDQSARAVIEHATNSRADYFLEWDACLIEQHTKHQPEISRLSATLGHEVRAIPETYFRISPADVGWASTWAYLILVDNREEFPLSLVTKATQDLQHNVYLVTDYFAYRVRSDTAGFCTRSIVNDPIFFALINCARSGSESFSVESLIPVKIDPEELRLVQESRQRVISEDTYLPQSQPIDKELAAGWLKAITNVLPGGSIPLSHRVIHHYSSN